VYAHTGIEGRGVSGSGCGRAKERTPRRFRQERHPCQRLQASGPPAPEGSSTPHTRGTSPHHDRTRNDHQLGTAMLVARTTDGEGISLPISNRLAPLVAASAEAAAH
jgi:hypothetical protein